MAAMIESVARHGYEGATVGEVVALAGVSKTAFYRRFESKEACFLATFGWLVEQGAAQIAAAYGSGDGFEQRMKLAFSKLAEIVVERTAAAHFVFVDSFALGAASIGPREEAARTYESMLRAGFEAAPMPGEVSPLTVRAIYGGLRDVAYHRLRDCEPERLGEHVEELVDWGVDYRLAAAAGTTVGARLVEAVAESDGPLPRARKDATAAPPWEEPAKSALSRRVLGQRERIVRAAAQVASRDGYGALKVSEISKAAGTSNQTFYRYFSSKQEAFLAAFDAIALEAFELTRAAYVSHEDWLLAGTAGILALLEHVARNPIFRQMNFFELHAAGPLARDRAEAMLTAFTAFMQPDPAPPEVGTVPPKVVIEAIAGGIWAVLQHEIVHGRSEELPDLAPQILDIILLPFKVRFE